MSSVPTNPPGDLPPIPPYWNDENDWIVIIEFLPKDHVEDRTEAAERIGYMLAYAQMTDTRMLALLGDPQADAYELLFSFNSAENKTEFLRLLNSNELSAYDDKLIQVPPQDEIDAAQLLCQLPSSGLYCTGKKLWGQRWPVLSFCVSSQIACAFGRSFRVPLMGN
jgi:hypothetical protein